MRNLKFAARALAMAFAWLALTAHVGSDIVVFEGQAGGYPLRVIIRPQGVVPAQVPIVVRVLSGTPTRVTVRAAQWNLGTKSAPAAEVASPVPGEPNTYARDLWIMTSSSYAVHVAVEGPQGAGELLVPMQSVATRTLGMTRGTGEILIALAALLIIGMLTLVGAATRDATLEIGLTPDRARTTRARVAMGVTAAVVAVALVGGAKWWNAEEAAYKTGLYRPYHVVTSVRAVDDTRILTLKVDDAEWQSRRNTPIMPDHGKLMHMFLIRETDGGVIAHLHPRRVDAETFETSVPNVPGGRYFLFADVVHESGFQRTFVDTVNVPVAPVIPGAPPAGKRGKAFVSATAIAMADTDDAWGVVKATEFGFPATFATGGTITLTSDAPLVAGRDLRLLFAIKNEDNSPMQVEPYMGMAGHAMILRNDGKVFVHLHPAGTASMAAQAALADRERRIARPADSTDTMQHPPEAPMADMNSMTTVDALSSGGQIAFPFAFPTGGDYKVFVQIKRKGVVETAAFKVKVKP